MFNRPNSMCYYGLGRVHKGKSEPTAAAAGFFHENVVLSHMNKSPYI